MRYENHFLENHFLDQYDWYLIKIQLSIGNEKLFFNYCYEKKTLKQEFKITKKIQRGLK